MKKILIIEDDLSIAELERDYLEVAGFGVDICTNGRTGVDMVNSNSYDLILLDIMLPELDGMEVLKLLRERHHIPVLLVSAKKDEIDKIRGFSQGANDYITKPFSPSELVARIKAHINNYERIRNSNNNSGNQNASNPNIIHVKNLEIQKDSMRAFVNEKEIFLAQKEYELLLFLAQSPNRVFTRDELYEKIWGFDSLSESATVTVHIARIREKIENISPHSQFIETVWGVGYRFKTTE